MKMKPIFDSQQKIYEVERKIMIRQLERIKEVRADIKKWKRKK